MWAFHCDTKMKSLICSLLKHFPPVEFVFAYGSGVLKQDGREMGKMVDLIFVVRETQQWHARNLQLNPSHYSFLKYFGSSVITTVQKYPAAVYYNTLVNVNITEGNSHQLIKYGIISVEDFYSDLFDWRWLYTSGRLQKPVVQLNQHLDNIQLNKAIQSNYKSAIVCALLLMEKKSFSMEELFVKITSLSYMGDFRMIIGEDKNKIRNIVKPALVQFKDIYSLLIAEFLIPDTHNQWKLKDPGFCLSTASHLLPGAVRARVATGNSLKKSISSIVATASLIQSLKGVATAGVLKSVQYGGAKLGKMFKSL